MNDVMNIDQTTVDEIHLKANEAFMNLVSMSVQSPAAREARENALLSIVGIRKSMERLGLQHSVVEAEAMTAVMQSELTRERFRTVVRQMVRGEIVLFQRRYHAPALLGWNESVYVRYNPCDVSVIKIYNQRGEYVCDAGAKEAAVVGGI